MSDETPHGSIQAQLLEAELAQARGEIARLRGVIRTGGAMYRLERAALGIPGGIDPHDSLGTPEPVQLLKPTPMLYGLYDQKKILHAVVREEQRAAELAGAWGKSGSYRFKIWPMHEPVMQPEAYVVRDQMGQHHGTYEDAGNACHAVNNRRTRSGECCFVSPVFVVAPPGEVGS